MYKAYRCKKCNTVFMIPIEDIERMEKQKRYVACPFGHKAIEELDKYDSIRECMEEARTYKKKKGRFRQIK